MSFQADVALQTAEAVLNVLDVGLQSGDSALELGYWTGILASRIAARHPGVWVVGALMHLSFVTSMIQRFSPA